MKIGILTGLWHIASHASLIESIEKASDLGFRYVDLHGMFHARPGDLAPDECLRVPRILDRLGLVARNYVLPTYVNIPSASISEQEEALGYTNRGIDLAAGWGISQVLVNAGQWALGVGHADAWKRTVGFMRHVCEYAERNGVLIALEPEPYVWYLVNYLASAGEMLEDVARPNIGLLVDLGHMALAREGLDDLRPLANQILHVHLSDHEAYRHTNQPIGSGFVPVVDYLGGLLSLNVDGIAGRFGYEEMVVTLELGATGDTIQDPDSWARRSLAYVLGTGLPIRLR